MELAIDFAAVTGCDICPVLQGKTDDGVQLMRHVCTWGRVCNLLVVDPGALPTTDESQWLYRLGGVWEKYKCFVEHPIVGDRTVKVLKSLHTEMQAVALWKDLASLRRLVADGMRETVLIGARWTGACSIGCTVLPAGMRRSSTSGRESRMAAPTLQWSTWH